MRPDRAWLPVLMVALALLLSPAAVRAHDLLLARVQLSTLPDGALAVAVALPTAEGIDEPVLWPQGCSERSATRQDAAGQFRLRFVVACNAVGPDVSARVPWGQDGILLQDARVAAAEPVLLHGGEGAVALPLSLAIPGPRPLTSVAVDYLGLGAQHILEGWDHLAFVLCLCLLLPGWRLVWLVTAFTVGHSLSLAASFLGYVTLPVPPVEAVIALSIVFMAREAWLHRQRAEVLAALGRYSAVVLAFGLLHGLGFASVLGDLGVATSERTAGLLFFNLGVEVGQLLFVACVLVALILLRGLRLEPPARAGALLMAGGVGLAWTVERVTGYL